jgi:prepilin signal peptidase PulO-like enzyme (type II secretory pathway)
MISTVYLILVMLWVIVTDFKRGMIYDAAGLGLVVYAYAANMLGYGIDAKSAVIGMVVGASIVMPFFLMGHMGGGDVKLLGALGLWFGLRIIDVFLFACILGLFVGAFYWLKERRGGIEVPFGPAIAVSAVVHWVTSFSLVMCYWGIVP